MVLTRKRYPRVSGRGTILVQCGVGNRRVLLPIFHPVREERAPPAVPVCVSGWAGVAHLLHSPRAVRIGQCLPHAPGLSSGTEESRTEAVKGHEPPVPVAMHPMLLCALRARQCKRGGGRDQLMLLPRRGQCAGHGNSGDPLWAPPHRSRAQLPPRGTPWVGRVTPVAVHDPCRPHTAIGYPWV